MKLTLLLFAIFSLFALALAVKAPRKSVIVSFPASTPDDIVEQAQQVIREAGGSITHTFKLIKGFAAKVQQKGLDSINALSTDPNFKPTIEEDQIVTAF